VWWERASSIEDKIPDHLAFFRARDERFRNSDIFRNVDPALMSLMQRR